MTTTAITYGSTSYPNERAAVRGLCESWIAGGEDLHERLAEVKDEGKSAKALVAEMERYGWHRDAGDWYSTEEAVSQMLDILRTVTVASVYAMDEEGGMLADGLQPSAICDEAIETACQLADQRGEDVHLVDDDGEWIVHPAGPDGTREAADRHDRY